MVFGLGTGGLSVHIDIQPSQDGLSRQFIVPIDHPPSWKLNKNVFANAKKKSKNSFVPLPQVHQQQQQMQGYNPQQQQPQYDANGQMIMQYPHNSGMMMPPNGHPPPPPPDMMMQRGYGYGGVGMEQMIYAYDGQYQDVQGVANIMLEPGKKYDHNGIKIHFIGRVEMSQAIYEGRPNWEFIYMTKEIFPPGTLYQSHTTVPFHFHTEEKPFETYHGRNVNIKYFIRVAVERKFLPPMTKDAELIVQIPKLEPSVNEAIKMEVGIEECLHIEFTYSKRFYHLNDFIVGNIHFLLVRIKIKYMELAVIRRETSGEGVARGGSGGNMVTETQTLTRFEIMDGAPVRGEVIPVKLYLGGIGADLTPTFDAGVNRFTVKYYLNLVLVDEEDRRYFKQQEIILWRKELG